MKSVVPVKPLFICLLLVFSVSCLKLKGEFALKFAMQDSYRRITAPVQINKNETVQWLYQLDTMPSQKVQIGIILLKKEVIWVDVLVQDDIIGMDVNVVYGTIKDLDEGQYRLVLTDVKKNAEIDSFEFTVYSDDAY
ncbi:MAG TPA: hypothetical protein PK926_05460 [Spirochaetota bacterium]|nr:hypothetical protein [Spirochaetota bacterium]HPI89266.1 hypothetical protein [Spirochaetota bacterium]HPR48574.1 hypothetical protein [Spirochaetota bacterium]